MRALNDFEVNSVAGARITFMTIGNGDLDVSRGDSAMSCGQYSNYDVAYSSSNYTTGNSSSSNTIGYGGQAEGTVGGYNAVPLLQNPCAEGVLGGFIGSIYSGNYIAVGLTMLGGAIANGCFSPK